MKRKTRYSGKSSCNERTSEGKCTKPCTRLKDAWIPLCDDCFIQGGYENYPDHKKFRIKENRFPNKHRGLEKCPNFTQNRGCTDSQLIIVYGTQHFYYLFLFLLVPFFPSKTVMLDLP